MSTLQSKQDALEALGLHPGASPDAIKAAFRARAKAAHPDVTAPTPESLAALASAIAAMRILESEGDITASLEISAEQARQGAVRLVSMISKKLMVRIPPGITDGTCLTAIGDTAQVCIRVSTLETSATLPALPPSALPDFIEKYTGRSPAARFAGWLRRTPPAA